VAVVLSFFAFSFLLVVYLAKPVPICLQSANSTASKLIIIIIIISYLTSKLIPVRGERYIWW